MTLMKLNDDHFITEVQIDPVTDDYMITIPEAIINRLGWYEDTVLEWTVDGDTLVLQEVKND